MSNIALHTFISGGRLSGSESPHAMSTICGLSVCYGAADLTHPFQEEFTVMVLTDMTYMSLRYELEQDGHELGNDICVLLSV